MRSHPEVLGGHGQGSRGDTLNSIYPPTPETQILSRASFAPVIRACHLLASPDADDVLPPVAFQLLLLAQPVADSSGSAHFYQLGPDAGPSQCSDY